MADQNIESNIENSEEEKVEVLTKFYLKSGAVIEIRLTDLELFADPEEPGSLVAITWKTKSPGPALEYLRIEDVCAVITIPPVEWNVS